jgi:RNA methyltransferase, TrmH family
VSADGTFREQITSSSNPLVKLAKQLGTRRRVRHKEQLFLIEGERALRTAIEHQTSIHTIVIDAERGGEIPTALVHLFEVSARRTVEMSHALFTSIADSEHPQYVLAIAQMPGKTIQQHPTGIIVLDAVRDPGNIGTIIRTAVAAGIDGIVLLPGCVDPYNPKSVRASAGMVTSIPIVQSTSVTAAVESFFAPTCDVEVLTAEATGTTDYRDADWQKPFVLVVGNEGHGISSASNAATTKTVRIPMAAGVESLNVSVATGIILFEMRSRRTLL